MKICIAAIVYVLLFTSSAFANVCGLIEVADGSLLEVYKGKIYDEKQVFLTESVPTAKKVIVSSTLGAGQIEKFTDKKKKKLIKISFTLTSGKKLSAQVAQASSLVFFDAATESFVWLKLKEGEVARAKISTSGKKLKFVINEDEFFSKDRCY